MKVGKKEITSLVVALERFLQRDFTAEPVVWDQRVHTVLDILKGVAGIRARYMADLPEQLELHPVPVPRAWIDLRDHAQQKMLLSALANASPALSVRQIGRTTIAIAPDSVRDGEEVVVAQRHRQVLLAEAGG
ncbi:MAG TPA: hypothetical protein VK726_05620 [Acetobacteraceae bacterium]|nr:hypothetical protein [Acetobacteraceae bacterium]